MLGRGFRVTFTKRCYCLCGDKVSEEPEWRELLGRVRSDLGFGHKLVPCSLGLVWLGDKAATRQHCCLQRTALLWQQDGESTRVSGWNLEDDGKGCLDETVIHNTNINAPYRCLSTQVIFFYLRIVHFQKIMIHSKMTWMNSLWILTFHPYQSFLSRTNSIYCELLLICPSSLLSYIILQEDNFIFDAMFGCLTYWSRLY